VKPIRYSRGFDASWRFGEMDLSDVGVRHAVAFTTLNIIHSVDISPSAVSIAREIRISIIAIVVGLTAASIVKSVLLSKKSPP